MMLALAASFASYEFLKPAQASAANIAPAAAALDDNSVNAHHRSGSCNGNPGCTRDAAVVNVTVTSRAKQQQTSGRDQDEIQRFFGPFGFGPQGPQMAPGAAR